MSNAAEPQGYAGSDGPTLIPSTMSIVYPNGHERALYLQQIDIETVMTRKLQIILLIDNDAVDIRRNGKTWTPIRSLEIPLPCKTSLILESRHTFARIKFGRIEEKVEISDQEIAQAVWDSNKSTRILSRAITFHGQPATIMLQLRPSPTFEATIATAHKLQRAIKHFKHFMSHSTLQHVDRVIKYAVAFSEVNPNAKAAFSVLSASFELLKEQRKYDDLVSDLVDRVGRMLPFIKPLQAENMDDDIELLEGVIKKVYDLILDTAEFITGYVRRSALKRTWKFIISMQDRDRIAGLVEDFGKLETDFDRAVNVEALKVAKKNKFIEEDRYLQRRLDPVRAAYNADQCCMPGTRKAILEDIVTWALQPLDENTAGNTAKVFWLYGIPGVGKTAVANSLCSRLRNEKRLGGSFFCRRDDPHRGEPKYVLPRLIFELAEVWAPYRKIVIEKLQGDPKLNAESAGHEVFLQTLETLQKTPSHPLILVIDALNECGEPEARSSVLRILFKAAARLPWMKIIITSRQERDIEEFFQTFDTLGLYLSRDLASDSQTHEDITLFAQSRFSSIASRCYLPTDWPGQELLNKIVARASGLFIYVETVWLLVKDEPDPEESLTKAIHDKSGDAMSDLHRLYSNAIESHIGKDKEVFRRVIEVVIAVASYCPLRDETIAALTGVKASVVRTLVDGLNSLLYRDNGQKGGIRVRHLSIIDFLVGPTCPPELCVDPERANMKVGLACLTTMIGGLKFNICKLETSLLSNNDIEDLDNRIEANISDQLQYSCLYWAKHLCITPYPANSEVCAKLSEFFQDCRPLFWIEVLSVIGKAAFGVRALRQILLWIKNSSDECLRCVKDVLRFLLTFHTPITTSAPHIYTSALPFMPKECELWKNANLSFERLMKVEKGRMELWPSRPVAWLGHKRTTRCIAYSPDGLHIVSGSDDNTIRMWDVETGCTIGEPWEGHLGSVRCIAYSPDGRHIISGSADETLRLWDVETGCAIGEPWIGHTNLVSSVAYSPDGRHIVSGSWDKTLRLWDAETGRTIGGPWKRHISPVNSVVYSPDGLHVVSGSEDKTLRIWDVKTGRTIGKRWKGHTASINSVAYSPDGRHVVSGSWDKTLRLWDTETGRAIGEPWQGHTNLVFCIAYSPDGRQVVSGSWDKTLRLWDAETGRTIGESWQGHTNLVTSVVYSPDGQHVVSGSEDKMLRMWSAENGCTIGEPWEEHTNPVNTVAYSPDGRHIVSGSHDKTLRLWDAKTGSAIGQPWNGHFSLINSIAYSPDGRSVVSGSWDNTIRRWDAATGSAIGGPWEGHANLVYSVTYSPDGCYVVSGSADKTLRLWDPEAGHTVGPPWQGHTDSVYSVTYSPDGRYVVSGSYDKTLRIWDAETGHAIGEPWTGHSSSVLTAAYSPDGRRVISGSTDKTIRMWDAATGRQIGDPWEGHTSSVNSVAYSPDGRHVISGSNDNTLRMWDAETGCAIGEPRCGHTSWVYSVAYSPDGRHIVSGSADNTLRIWDASPTSIISNPFVPNSSGWVTGPDGGLLFWVPEDCRHGLAFPSILCIPTNGPNRAVRLDSSDFRYGTSWTEIYKAGE